MDWHDFNKSWLGKSGDIPHPALFHMLDVAAVAQELQRHRPVHSDPAVCDAVTALIGLHDLGKICASFQGLLRGQGQSDLARHWRVTGYYFREFQDVLRDHLGIDFRKRPLNPVLMAVICHHGDFREPAPRFDPDHVDIGSEARVAARAALEFFMQLFEGAGFPRVPLPPDEVARLAWRVSGLVVQSDWIGSRPEWFPPCAPDVDPMAYWQRAQDQARHAVAGAGLFRADVSGSDAASLFGDGIVLRPMQQAVVDVDIPDAPALFVLEDMTGSGKTEAALILAQRLMQAGHGRGVFFALPSMATSNSIYDRVQPIVPRMFDGDPQVALTHSKAALNNTFQAALNDQSDAGTTCSQWLADDRRRVLFADFAVGTIDQALMSILPTRFNTLRQWALSHKILIVDEAHSYDPYMEGELEALLKFHRYYGGSAIVMTATLPKRMKQKFIATYCETKAHGTGDYPLLSVAASDMAERAVAPAPENVRRVEVERVATADAAIDLIVAAAQEGAAVAWVRNAVDDAIAAAQMLEDRGVAVDLLHARFTMGDRLDKEAALIQRFGKAGTGRAGRVVVATQVIEQSLDLDFDVMVSDLAPIGSLVQRAGRLWRHRDRMGRPVNAPILYVFSPNPQNVVSNRWLHDVLDRGAWVYDLTTQWRTAQVLFEAGGIDEPSGLRALIDRVHSDALIVPDILMKAEAKRAGEVYALAQAARSAALRPKGGLAQMQAVTDDDEHVTRLGEPQKTLRLAHRVNGELVPLNGTWPLSEVSVALKKVRGLESNIPAQERDKMTLHWPKYTQTHITLLEVSDGGRIAHGLTYSGRLGLLFS